MSHTDLLSTTSKIVALARSGFVSAARKLFDEMPERDTIAWNAMLTAYSHSGLTQQALSLFSSMRASGMRPDPFSFTSVLSASANGHELSSGKKFHALVFRFGFQSLLPVCNSLVDMYGKCSCPFDALKVFEKMEEPNEVSWCSLLHAYVKSGQFEHAHQLFSEMPVRKVMAWNILIGGYTQLGQTEHSIDLLKKMQTLGFEGDFLTFASLMNACTELSDPCFGLMIHSCIVRRGWTTAIEVNNSVLSFYAKHGCRDDAFKIFESMDTRSQVSWNAMIDAHVKIGDIEGALSVFQRAPETNIVSWTTMIAGYARNGHGEEALGLFVFMTRNLFSPDDFTFGAVLHACSNLAVIGHGRMVHSFIIHYGFSSYLYVGNGLVNMYAKCGDIKGSSQVFDGILEKDLVSWNAMLFGFALHGRASKAYAVYEDMVAHDVFPDKMTFIGLLMACSHSGLIGRGRTIFETMEAVHGVTRDVDHITCMVDMLGRAGRLEEANKLLEGYSGAVSRRTTNSCEALLSACTVFGDLSIGRMVGKELVTMEPQKEVGYVMLSNLYCASGQWKEAEKVRRVMVEQGVKKAPGCSWIEVRNKVIVFVTGVQSVHHMKDVYKIVGLLESEMRNPSSIYFNNEP